MHGDRICVILKPYFGTRHSTPWTSRNPQGSSHSTSRFLLFYLRNRIFFRTVTNENRAMPPNACS